MLWTWALRPSSGSAPTTSSCLHQGSHRKGPPPQRGVDADPERLLGWLWQGRHTEVPSGPLDCSSCCSACTVLCTVVGPTVPEATTWPWARPSLQHGPARWCPTHAVPIARSAGPMTTLRDPSPGVQLAVAPLHHRLQRCQAHCRRQVTGTGAVPQQTEI